jgi:hypothetical protein
MQQSRENSERKEQERRLVEENKRISEKALILKPCALGPLFDCEETGGASARGYEY